MTNNMETILRNLFDINPLKRAEAVWELGANRYKEAINPLLLCLNDPCSDVRGRAAWALASINDLRALEKLISSFVNETDPVVRHDLILAISQFDSDDIVEPLLIGLKDEHPDVRLVVVQTMGNLRKTKFIEPLYVVLNEDPEKLIRDAAFWSINQISDKTDQSEFGVNMLGLKNIYANRI